MDELLKAIKELIRALKPVTPVDYHNKIPVEWGVVSTATKNLLTSPGHDWEPNMWAGDYELSIIEGTGIGQKRTITANTIDTITPAVPFNFEPDNTSVFLIRPLPILLATERANLFNYSVTGSTAILDDPLIPLKPPCAFRVSVSGPSMVLSVTIMRNRQTVTTALNSGAALTADALYTFDIPVSSGDQVNFQSSVSGTVDVFRVHEVPLRR